MRNFTIASVWGIPIRINISLIVFLPILAWLIGSGAQIATYAGIVSSFAPGPLEVAVLTAGTTPWLIGGAAAVGLFASVALHELGHAWAARRYGIGTRSITLWLLGGIASLDAMPREWNRELWIAIAGPAVSVLTAAGCYVAVLLLPASAQVTVFVFGWLVVTNVALTVFNLLPAFPMDGGRIFRAVLARSRSYESATRTAARFGTGFAVLFAVVGVLSFAPLLILLALFIYAAAASESKAVALQGLLADLTMADVASLEVDTVDADATVSDLAERMLRQRRTVYPVADGGQILGVVTLDGLRGVAPADRDTTTVRSVVDADVPRIPVVLGAFDGFSQVSEYGSGTALVERDGRIVGTVSLTDFASVIQLRREGVGFAPRTAL